MLTMNKVSQLAKFTQYDADQNLPLPNIYFSTITTADGKIINTHMAADHTNAVIRGLSDWCADIHGFRPNRATCVIKLRRMRLGDVLDAPETHAKALRHAKDAGDMVTVRALEALPTVIAMQLGLTADLGAVVARSAAQTPLRELRA